MHEDTSSSTDTRPTIFLIEEDNHAHRPLKRNLRRLGYRVLAVLDLEDALEWASVTRIPADLVLINLVGKSVEETLEMGRTLRERAKYDGHTPLVVMPDKVDKKMEGRDVNVDGNDWISYYEDGYQLQRLLDRLLPRMPSA
ncbi:MAG: response regulator [Acidobacteriota bacterium]|nr:response regulator [Acidobacteriota bacterium]